MAVYYKPQSPIQSGEDFIYPITTADQIMKSDKSRRLEQAGLIVADNSTSLGGVAAKDYALKTDTAPDSSKLGGVAASDYALKTDTAPDSSKLGGKTLAEIMLTIYPVGSVYISMNSTSPASLFGGEWTQINGRFLIGTGAPENNDDGTSPGSYNFAADSKGGEATHTLTKSEMPEHGHNALRAAPGWGESITLSPWTVYFTSDAITDAGSSGETARFWIYDALKYTGDGLAHNNMPPYLAVYMWKRVS